MPLKTKISLDDGEAYVVAPLEFWEHLIMVYRTLAEEQNDKQDWLEAAEFISSFIADTLYMEPDEDDGWQ